MRTSRLSLKRSLLLSAFFAVAVFSTTGFAQNNNDNSTPAPAKPSANPTSRNPTRPTPTAQPSEAPSPSTSPTARETEKPPAIGQTTTTPTAPTPTDNTDSELPPALTRTYYNGLIPTYPPPGIPPTNNAPFMNHSTLPDGTVFIAVGAILGAFGIAILVWRGIVACLLHRSVEKAAMAQHIDTNKAAASFPAPPAPFYKFTDRDSSPSLPGGGAGAAGAARLNRKSHRGPTPSATPSQTNLFFSPTAAPSGMGSMGNRDSRFLPSGFYASASPAQMGQHGHGNSISLSNLRPASRGHAGVPGPSPPDSPNVRAQTRNFSSSSVNLNRPPSGRAPSAFLDDLLDDPAYQGQFPPGQPGQTGPAPFGPVQGYGQGHARY